MEADNLSLTRKERRAKANREATLKKPIVSPRIQSNPFDFVFFTWFGPILRLVSFAFPGTGQLAQPPHCQLNCKFLNYLCDLVTLQLCHTGI